jgi:hypothetical protein
MSAAKPHVDLDITRERLQRLGLAHPAEQLGERITTAVKETTSPHRFLALNAAKMLCWRCSVRRRQRRSESLPGDELALSRQKGCLCRILGQRFPKEFFPMSTLTSRSNLHTAIYGWKDRLRRDSSTQNCGSVGHQHPRLNSKASPTRDSTLMPTGA